jgi:hypothetical protein
MFRLQVRGFTNRDLRDHLEPLLGRPPGTTGSSQATYDRRRLRHHGFIERIPHSPRYRVTTEGHRRALFLSRAHNRLLRGGPPTSPPRSPQTRHGSAPPAEPTKPRSTTYSPAPDSPPEPDPNMTQPERQTRLKK